jgi:RNA polymerase sigma factor (sigma-70 family)
MGVGDGGAWAAWSRDFAEGREPGAFWPALLDELRPLPAALLRGRPHEWEDVLQEAVLSLLEARARGRFDPSRGTVTALAATIVRRRCADRIRAERDRASRHPVADPPGEAADPGAGPEEAMIESESRRVWRRRFAQAIRELERQDGLRGSCRAQALLLRHREAIANDEWSFLRSGPSGEVVPWKEVADRLGISAEAARQNGSRGLRALRDILAAQAAQGEEPG